MKDHYDAEAWKAWKPKKRNRIVPVHADNCRLVKTGAKCDCGMSALKQDLKKYRPTEKADQHGRQ